MGQRWAGPNSGGSFQCILTPMGKWEEWARIFSVLHNDLTGGNVPKTETKIKIVLWLWSWPGTRTDCLERLYCLCPWRYSKSTWIWSWATRSSWPCWRQGWTRGACRLQPLCGAVPVTHTQGDRDRDVSMHPEFACGSSVQCFLPPRPQDKIIGLRVERERHLY